MKTLLTCIALLCLFHTYAQTPPCYTDQVWKRVAEGNPDMIRLRNSIEDEISKTSNAYLPAAQNDARAESPPSIVIPTVIYIVHNGTAASNISMQQIQSQMDQLNEDFATHGYAFCYAKRNVLDTTFFVPQAGDSAGVFRINNAALSDLDEYAEDAQLKALSPLSYKNYLRIFVVNNISPAGVLGYALLPGSESSRDGIVVRADVFGSNALCQSCTLMPHYNLGKTLTHEAGHYLNLFHTFQGGCTPEPQPGISCQTLGDRVCDTPPTTGTFGCPGPAPLSCDNTTPQQVENYMDYTNDACKTMFSTRQKMRMDQSVSAYRTALVSTENLIRTGINCIEIGNEYASIHCANFNGCTDRDMIFMSLSAPGFIYTWNFGDGTTAIGDTVAHTYNTEGRYQLSLSAVNTGQGVSATQTITIFITYCAPITCSTNKWSGNYVYLDFSSGTPVAQLHPKITPWHSSAIMYYSFYRGDNQGNPLFHLSHVNYNINNPAHMPLFDTTFQVVDSILGGNAIQVIPVLSTPGKYCIILRKLHTINGGVSPTDSILYSFVQADNGTVHTITGKADIKVNLLNNSVNAFYTTTFISIPNCDGSAFWIIVPLNEKKYGVLKMTSDTVYLHSTYAVPDIDRFKLSASPDGRTIIACGHYLHTTFYLMDFNKSTGDITGHRTMPTGGFDPSEKPCFSPNSRFLYHTDGGNAATGYVYQFDLYDTNPVATKKIIHEFKRPVANLPSPTKIINIGPDNKIYIGHIPQPSNVPEGYRPGVINFPDVKEDGTNSVGYNHNGPYLKPSNNPHNGIQYTGIIGINDNTVAYGCNWNPTGAPTYNVHKLSCREYKFYTDECYSSTWNFGDPASGVNNTSNLSKPAHTFSAPGKYAVTLTSNGQTFTDTIHITTPNTSISQSPIACGTSNGNYSVVQVQPGINYVWTVTEGTPGTVAGTMNINVQWNTGAASGQIKLVAIDTLYGCIDSSVTNITTTSGGITEPAVIVNGAALSTGNYSTYQWLLNDVVIPNANQQQYTATQTGLYQVIVSNGSACIDTSKKVPVTITGVDALLSPKLELYPNPASESLTIITNQTAAALTVYDAHGSLIHRQNLNQSTQTLDISNWPSGIYYIEVNSKSKITRKKFVKL